MSNAESKRGIENAEWRWLVEPSNHVTAVIPHITTNLLWRHKLAEW